MKTISNKFKSSLFLFMLIILYYGTVKADRVWGVNSSDQIWTRAGVNGTWKRIDGALKQISVGADGRVWGVNSSDQIWTREGVNGTWQKIDGALKHISVFSHVNYDLNLVP